MSDSVKFDKILAEIRGIRAEMREDKAELRREIRFNNRVTLGLLIVLTVLTVKIVIGF